MIPNWKRILGLGILAGALLLLFRGCIAACGLRSEQADPTSANPTVRVYDHRKEAVLKMPLEAYLVGVTAAEMPVSFGEEALKAQAVAARTYTVSHMMGGGCKSAGGDVCTDSGCCQAYCDEERMAEKWGRNHRANRKKIAAAVSATAGEVLLYEGKPIDALYHSASGGHTENAEDVYAAALPYLRGVPSTAETGTARLTGEKRWTKAAFAALVKEKFPAARLNSAALERAVAVTALTPGGQVKTLQLGSTTVTGRQARSAFSLDSARFTVSFTKDEILFSTAGYGHGVGMSQTGANAMALGGRSYREILAYYYTGVTLGQIAASVL